MTKLLTVCILVLTAGATVPSFANSTASPSHVTSVSKASTLPMETMRSSRFKILDINGDGYITADEIDKNNSTLRSQFSSLDENHDGRLTEGEYTLFGKAS